MSALTMAKKPPRKPNPNVMTTRAWKMRQEYADWLELFARFNRTTLAGLFDQALLDFAEKKGFRKPPERTDGGAK